MQDIRGQDKTDETRQYRTGMPASAASNVSDDFAGHLSGARHTDAKHKPSGWKTQKKYGGQGKTDETRHDRTGIPASDASNASEVQNCRRQCKTVQARNSSFTDTTSWAKQATQRKKIRKCNWKKWPDITVTHFMTSKRMEIGTKTNRVWNHTLHCT